jgi:peptidoglycan/xylan/chitin deacetylase (PgdA/CDA1 family)
MPLPTRVPTLLYHDVVADERWTGSGFPGGDAAIYKLDSDAFTAHVGRLHASGLEAPLLTAPISGGGRRFVITFDDGGVSAITTIAPTIERFGWRGYFFMTTGWLGAAGFLDRTQLRELRARGHVIGSHSETHPLRMSSCTPRQLRHEWTSSAERLADVLGERPATASIPGGAYSYAVAEAAGRAGIKLLFTSEPTARSWDVGDVTCLGRFTVWRGMTPDRAVALARGHGIETVRQRLAWDSKKVAKAVLGPTYQKLREQLLASRSA